MRTARLEQNPITDTDTCYILAVNGGYLDIVGEKTQHSWLAKEFSWDEFGKEEARKFARKYGYEPDF